jgi:DNA polymerase III sliding clamp (beta) subunit (PCNA family)
MISLTSPKFRFLLRAVLPAASADSTRPHLACVQIVARDGWIEATTTDGARLHRARVKWQPVSHDAPEPSPIGTFLVARSAAEAALKSLPAVKRGQTAPVVTISPTGLETPTGAVRFPTITERFPDVDRVIPGTHASAAISCGVNPAYVGEAAEACALVSERTAGLIWHQPESGLDPIRLTAEGYVDDAEADVLCVIMPMRV